MFEATASVFRGINNFLAEEWVRKQPPAARDTQRVVQHKNLLLNLRHQQAEVPQQDNSCDCGLFLLHYVELFSLQPWKDLQNSNHKEWFKPADAKKKRQKIKVLIAELSEEEPAASD